MWHILTGAVKKYHYISLQLKILENLSLLAQHCSRRNKYCMSLILLSGWQVRSIPEESSWFSSSMKFVMPNREPWRRRRLLWSSCPIWLIIALILLTMHWTKAVIWLYFIARGRVELLLYSWLLVYLCRNCIMYLVICWEWWWVNLWWWNCVVMGCRHVPCYLWNICVLLWCAIVMVRFQNCRKNGSCSVLHGSVMFASWMNSWKKVLHQEW